MAIMKTVLPALLIAGLLAGATAELEVPPNEGFTSGVVVSRNPGIGPSPNIASCSISIQSGTLSESLSSSARSAAQATSSLLCNGTLLENTENALETAGAIAFAAAEAVAAISVDCYSSGNSRFSVNGMSIAQATAEAYAEAFVSVTASSSVCSPSFNCTSVATFVGKAFESVFATAVAEAEVSLDQDSPETTVMEFAMDVQNTTAEVFALAIADAAASVANGCDVEALGRGVAGDSSIFCSVDVATQDSSTANDAVADFAIQVVADAGCGGLAEKDFNVTGESLAEAIASVIAEVSSACDTAGTGSVCITGEANLTAVVNATATAFAFAYLSASRECDEDFCEISTELLGEAVSTVVSRAAADILVEQCAEGGGEVDIMEVTSDLVANTTKALVSIIANATVIGGQCTVNASEFIAAAFVVPPSEITDPGPAVTVPPPVVTVPPVVITPPPVVTAPPVTTEPVALPPPVVAPSCPAGTDPECVRDSRQCAGVGIPTARPCCSEDFLCVRRSNLFSQCRLNGVPGSTRWEGSILPCGVASDIPADQL